MNANGSLPSSTVFSISDRELLFIVQDHAHYGERRVQVAAMIETLNLHHEHARQSISTRLGYMGRIGLVTKGRSDGPWRLTTQGHDFVRGQLTPSERGTILDLLNSPGALLEALHQIGRHERQYDGDAIGYGLRRQWRHSTGRN